MAAITVVFIAAIALTALFFAGASGKDTLVLRDGDTKEEYARFPVSEGDEFSVTFIHSVNQYPLTDVYEIRDHRIYVVRTIYNNFGAGVQTEIEEGQKLEYGENGEMIVSGFDQKMTGMIYVVGMVSDHVLDIGGAEYSLTALCGKGAAVKFVCKEVKPWQK